MRVQQPGPRQISDKQHLLEIAGDVRLGQKIKVKFKTEGIPELMYLVGMDGAIVTVNSSDHMVILAVIQSNDWDGERNRTIEMEALAGFDPDWFAGRLWRGLESAQVL